jgi:hypothetical protein
MKYRKYPNWVIITNKEIPFPYKMSLLRMLEVFNLRFYNKSSRLTTDCGEEEKLSDWGKAPLFKFIRTLIQDHVFPS